MAVTQLLRRPAAPPPSEGRQRLAEAIETLKAAEAEHAAVQAASGWDGRAAVAEREARDAVEVAEKALQQAQRNAADALVNESFGAPPPAGLTVKAARLALQSAEDDLAAAVTARATIEARREPAEKAVFWAREKVQTRALEVMRGEAGPAIEALLERIRTVHREVVDLGLTLNALWRANIVPTQGPNAYPGASELWSRFTHGANQWSIANTKDASPTSAIWTEALEALKTDASTPLPSV